MVEGIVRRRFFLGSDPPAQKPGEQDGDGDSEPAV